MSYTPTTRARIRVGPTQINFLVGQTHYNIVQVRYLIEQILEECLRKTMADIEKWIKNYVPKRTGQLRENLLRQLQSSRVLKGQFLRLVLGSHITYMRFVDAYSTAQVRHANEPGYAYYYGHWGKITLNDPKAIGHFWGLLKLYARDRLKHWLRTEIFRQIRMGQRRPFTAEMKVTS